MRRLFAETLGQLADQLEALISATLGKRRSVADVEELGLEFHMAKYKPALRIDRPWSLANLGMLISILLAFLFATWRLEIEISGVASPMFKNAMVREQSATPATRASMILWLVFVFIYLVACIVTVSVIAIYAHRLLRI